MLMLMSSLTPSAPDATYDFHIHLEYTFERGLRFSLIDSDGSIRCTKSTLSELLRIASYEVNSIIFSKVHAF